MKNKGIKSERRVMYMKSTPLLRSLDAMRDHFEASGEAEFLIVPYIVQCAIALEAKLNDTIIDHCRLKWGDGGSNLLSAYLAMSFIGKLNMIVPLLTDNAYRINTDHWVYIELAALIALRNQIAHAKSVYEPARNVTETPSGMWYAQPGSDLETILGGKKISGPKRYHEAIEKLNKWFFLRLEPRQLKVAALVVPCRTQAPVTENAVYVKTLSPSITAATAGGPPA